MIKNNTVKKNVQHENIIDLIKIIKKMANNLYNKYGIIITFNQSYNNEIEILTLSETKILKQIKLNLINNLNVLDVTALYSVSRIEADNIIKLLSPEKDNIQSNYSEDLWQQISNIVCLEYLKNCINELLELHDDLTQRPNVLGDWIMTSYKGSYLFNIKSKYADEKYTTLIGAIEETNMIKSKKNKVSKK